MRDQNFLQVNQDKTEVLVIGPATEREKLTELISRVHPFPSQANTESLVHTLSLVGWVTGMLSFLTKRRAQMSPVCFRIVRFCYWSTNHLMVLLLTMCLTWIWTDCVSYMDMYPLESPGPLVVTVFG